jgi:exonuclease SbcC
MQLISLQLQDLRSYRQASIEFAPGVNAIVGSNGAGKSTVLAAIGLALFNTRPPSATNDELVREGARTAEIVVDFVSACDERRYQVLRRFGGSNQYRVLDPDRGHQLLAEGVADCESWLRQHLGVGPDTSLSDLFQHTIGVYQGAFTAPFLLTPAVRKPIFDPLLRVDEYPKAAQALQAPRRELDKQDQAAAVRLAEIGGRLQALPGLQQELAAAQQRITAGERALAQSRAALDVARQQCQTFDRLRAAVVEAQQARDRLAAEAGKQEATLTAAREALTRAEEAAQCLAAALSDHEAYLRAERERAGLEEARQRRDRLAARVGQLEARMAANQAAARAQQERLAALEETAMRATRLAPQAAQQATLEAALGAAKEAVLHLQQARQTAADLERRSAQQAARVAQLQEELARRERLAADQTAAQASVERLQHEAQQRQLRRGECQAARAQLEKQIADLDDAEGGLCPVCESPLTDEHRAELHERNATLLAELTSVLTVLEQAQRQADQERSELQRQLMALGKELNALAVAGQLAAALQDQSALQQQLEATGTQMAALGEPAREAERLQSELAALGNPAQALHTCQTELDRRPQLQAVLARTLDEQRAIVADLDAQRANLAQYADLDQRLTAVGATLREHLPAHNAYLANENEAAQAPARCQQVAALTDALAASHLRLADAATTLAAAGAAYDPTADQAAQNERLRLEKETAGQDATLEADRATLAQTRQRVAELEALLGEQADLQTTRAQIARAVRLIDWTRDLLRAAGPYVTRQLVHSISLEAARLYSELMDNYAVRLQWSESYELTLEVNGVARGYAQLSGGEQMCAALALRLALLRNLTGIDIAFFDEPTAHLDGERRALLAHTLTHVQGFGQIFVISHDSTFEQAAQAYYVVTKDGDGSHIERL